MGVANLLERIAPRVLWRHRIASWPIDTGEDEARLLPQLVTRSQLAIDIGAAEGAYTAWLVPLAARVVAFEPRPAAARRLARMFAHTSLVTVEAVALSDGEGSVALRVARDGEFLSTIEHRNALTGRGEIDTVLVARRPLDSFDYRDVGFIKIDVEGHELAVLRGAAGTIARDRPNLLIEAEDRHCPGAVGSVRRWLDGLSYRGFFLVAGVPKPLEAFDTVVHQNVDNLDADSHRRGVYINNFIFVPRERRPPAPFDQATDA